MADELDVGVDPWCFRQVAVEVKCRTSAAKLRRQPELHEQVRLQTHVSTASFVAPLKSSLRLIGLPIKS